MSAQCLFLVDGHSLAYRAFYAMLPRPLRNARGENTSVPWALTQLIRKLLAEHAPEHLGFVFDSQHGETFRHELFRSYKATRQKLDGDDEDDFKTSMRRVRAILDALRIPAIEVAGYEADDVIGTLAVRAAERGLHAVIVSSDTDFYQLIGPRISVIEPGRRGRSMIEPQWVDGEAAARRFGVPPERVVDYLALVGDPSDNIPGTRGIGPRTAIELIERYGDLECILDHAQEVEPKRARIALCEHAQDARLSRELVTIRTDAPVSLELDALRVTAPDRDRLRRLFIELDFHTLLRELAPEPAKAPRCQLLTSTESVQRLLAAARAKAQLAMEIVSSSEGAAQAPPVGIALAVEPGEAFYLPLRSVGSEERTRSLMEPVAAALASPAITKVGHNLKRATSALRRWSMPLEGPLFDVMLAACYLDPTRRHHDLERLVIERFGHRLGDHPASATAAPHAVENEWIADAGARADAVLRLAPPLRDELDHYGQRRLFEEIEMPLIPVVAELERVGVLVDQELFGATSRRISMEIVQVEQRIRSLAGAEVNLDSPAQLRELLFEKLRLPVTKRTKGGPSIDADVLEHLAETGHPLPRLLAERRELAKLRSAYTEALPALVDPRTGRLHVAFDQAAPPLAQLESAEPELRNIRPCTSLGASIQGGFIAPQGSRLLAADYAQLELRIAAHLSRDRALLAIFRDELDVHRKAAARLFGLAPDRVTPEMRALAKVVFYAALYGQGPAVLSQYLGIGVGQARAFIQICLGGFPDLGQFLDAQVTQARRRGYVETLFGRRRYLPELRARNVRVRRFGERVARSFPIQASAADLIKAAMLRLDRSLSSSGLPECRLVFQAHHELLFEVPDAASEAACRLVRREMEASIALAAPLRADIGTGPTWRAAVERRGAAE